MNPASFIARFRNINWLRPSVIALIGGNLVPLVALFIFHWDVFSLLFLFWMENVIIGVLNVVKMLLAGVGAKDLPRYGSLIFGAMKVLMIPFFCLHYGAFTFAHGMFIVSIFNKDALHQFGGFGPNLIFQIIHDNHLEWPFGALVASHLISFCWDYLWSGEYHRTNPVELMTQPYRRVVLMHITVIIGAFLTMALHLPEAALILLVVLKTATDLWGHENARNNPALNKFSPPASPTAAPARDIRGALQAAFQARAAATGQPNQKIPANVIGIILIVFVFAFGFFGLVGYQFYRTFVDFGRARPAAVSRPAPASTKPETTAWTTTANQSWIPDTPAAGQFRGTSFHANRGVLDGEVLTLSDTSTATNRAFVIRFTPEQMSAMANRMFQTATNDVSALPEIKLVTHEKNSKGTLIYTYTNGYSMRWLFGVRTRNKVPLKIYLCLPDAQKSFVAGAFKVAIK